MAGTMARTNVKNLLSDTPDDCIGAVVLDHEYRVCAVSDSVLVRSGLALADLLSQNALDLVHPDDLVRAAATIQDAFFEEGRSGEGMYRLTTKDGYEAFGIQIIHPHGAEGVAVMHFFEVSEVLRANELAADLVHAVRVLGGEFSLESVINSVSLMI